MADSIVNDGTIDDSEITGPIGQLTLTVDGTEIADFTMVGDYTESDFTFENGFLTTDVTCLSPARAS